MWGFEQVPLLLEALCILSQQGEHYSLHPGHVTNVQSHVGLCELYRFILWSKAFQKMSAVHFSSGLTGHIWALRLPLAMGELEKYSIWLGSIWSGEEIKGYGENPSRRFCPRSHVTFACRFFFLNPAIGNKRRYLFYLETIGPIHMSKTHKEWH